MSPHYRYESFLNRSYSYIGGVDEAGRGALAGVVVAAIVILNPNTIHEAIDDSKRLTPPQREKLARFIKKHAIAYATAAVPPRMIERINILAATRLAIRLAYTRLKLKPDCLLIDGRYLENKPHWRRYPPQTFTPPRKEFLLTQGDRRSFSIAAASILAKVRRDHIMQNCHRTTPSLAKYNFQRHKGYPVPAHFSALLRYGPSPLHRKTFLKNLNFHT